MEDHQIVELYLARDEAAIAQTAQKYGHRLKNLSESIVQDEQTAEECENDTYLNAWRSIPPSEPRDHLYAFLACITRRLSLNCCRDRERLKRSGFVSQLTAEMEQCIPASGTVGADDLPLRDTLNRFLAGLTPEKRRIFIRRYWFLDSVSDIAKRCAVSESKVKTTLFRCRAQLRCHLEKEGYNV